MDLIDRQAAIDALKEHEDDKGYLRGDFEEILEALPSAEPEPSDVARDIATIIENEKDMRVIAQPVRKGKWQWLPDRDNENIRYLCCSVCHGDGYYESNYCPNCGSDMRGEHD